MAVLNRNARGLAVDPNVIPVDMRSKADKLYDMVKYYTEPLDATFFALSDPTRRAVLARLAEGETTVSDLAAPFAMTLPALTKHLTLLENAYLIARKKAGRTVTCRLQPAGLKAAAEWMEFYEQFWPEQFDALAVFLDDKSAVPMETPCPPVKQRRSDSAGTSKRPRKPSSAHGRTRNS
jgi:DNA-binding transcriptional ArsR family regulator